MFSCIAVMGLNMLHYASRVARHDPHALAPSHSIFRVLSIAGPLILVLMFAASPTLDFGGALQLIAIVLFLFLGIPILMTRSLLRRCRDQQCTVFTPASQTIPIHP